MTDREPQLTDSAKLAIQNYIFKIIKIWISILGVGFVFMFLYIFFLLPDMAADKAIQHAKINELIYKKGNAEGKIEILSEGITKYTKVLNGIKRQINEGKFEQATDLFEKIEKSNTVALINNIDRLHKRISSIEKKSNTVALTNDIKQLNKRVSYIEEKTNWKIEYGKVEINLKDSEYWGALDTGKVNFKECFDSPPTIVFSETKRNQFILVKANKVDKCNFVWAARNMVDTQKMPSQMSWIAIGKTIVDKKRVPEDDFGKDARR